MRNFNNLPHLVKMMMFFCVIGMFSCKETEKKEAQSVKKINFSVAKEVRIPLDSLTPAVIPYYQLLRGDTLKYVVYNSFNKSLYLFDFRGEKQVQKISLHNAQDKIPNISSFYYLNKDTILLFPEYGSDFFICNDQGWIYSDKIKFVDDDDQDKIESHYISSSTPLVKIRNKIYINNSFGWVAREGDRDKFLLIEYDLNKKSSSFFIQHPPSAYDKNFDNSTFRNLKFTLKEKGETLIYSFGFDPYVYEYSGDKNNITAHFCAPDGFELPGRLKKGISDEESWLTFQTSFSFSDLIYDPYRNLFIRIGLMPYDMDDIRAGVVNPENPKKPMMYVFDENYNLLGEFLLNKENNYYFINIFPAEEGLYIQKVTEDEEYMYFDLINYEI